MTLRPPSEKQKIGLALSGGGVRASVFHLGVLKYLAEQQQLEKVSHISSVSGGSLVIGLIYKCNNYQWPDSPSFLKDVLPRVRHYLTTMSLQLNAILLLICNPLNWSKLNHRADVLAQAIRFFWGVDLPLAKLPTLPIWTINGTTGENGHRWRFRNGDMGDYELGYAAVDDIELAEAMAVSAAFPGGIGPLTIYPSEYQWFKRASWESKRRAVQVPPPAKTLHLYDGGLYDNLGMEALFDAGRQQFKASAHIDYMIISDAGSDFDGGPIPGPWNPLRFKRMLDIAMDQVRALRYRSFINFLKNQPRHGLFIEIGADATTNISASKSRKPEEQQQLLALPWLTQAEAQYVADYPTTLARMSKDDFDLIVQHGYENCQWNWVLDALPN